MKHRKFGGSTAARTIHCPGWAQQSEDMPKSPESDYAREGTALHACMEQILMENLNRENIADRFTGVSIEGVTITAEHVSDRLLPAFDAWGELVDQYGISDYEPEVECSYATDVGGYADIIATNDGGTVIIADWKFGQGVFVSPTNSHQGRFYAMAARKDSCIDGFFEQAKKIVIAIIQPNDRDVSALKIWETTTEALDEYEVVFNRAIKDARSESPTLEPGEHCKWCPAAPVCPQKTGEALRALQMRPEDLGTLSVSMAMVADLAAWIKAVQTATHEQLEAGASVVGWKLVAKRAITRWIDEGRVLKAFRRRMKGKKNMITEKLLSPAQLTKAAKLMEVELDLTQYTTRVSSGTTLAPFDDKREEVVNQKTLESSLASID